MALNGLLCANMLAQTVIVEISIRKLVSITEKSIFLVRRSNLKVLSLPTSLPTQA